MVKMWIINAVIFALIAYDILLFCHYKGWLGRRQKCKKEDDACHTAPFQSLNRNVLNNKLIAK